ncbi:MAG TPA: nitroreductase family protein [Peptococcaceae bacterium]|nr:MAG: Nitroreductase [Clostridia bacterium 41_269]HBT20085.1 nitroreductase family protein [Peptococcaceae bacterium]
MTNDVFEVIRERRSIRAFKPQNIPDEIVAKLLEAACRAPSAGNLQPWKFYVVKNEEIKKKLSAAAFNQSFVAQAPVVIVVCALPEESASRYGERGRSLYCIQDTAAAVQNLLLAAWALGIGSCWVGAFDEQMAASVLGLSKKERPVAIISLGYPRKDSNLWETSRKPVETVAEFIE